MVTSAVSRPSTTDLVLLAIAVAAVSTSAPLIREAAAPALVIAFWRNGMACAVLVPYTAARHREEARTLDRRERRLAVLAGALLAAHFATWIPSLSFTSVASSVALVATQPAWAALIARLRGHHVPGVAWLGIAISFAGALVLSGVDLSLSARALGGDGLALAGGMLAAAYVTVGAEVRRTVSTPVYTSVCYSVTALALLLVCVASRQNLGHHSARTWGLFVAITVGPQLLGHSVFNRVLRTTSATVVSVAILFEIVGATFIAWIWFGETPPVAAYPAAVLIAGGLVLVISGGRTPSAAVD